MVTVASSVVAPRCRRCRCRTRDGVGLAGAGVAGELAGEGERARGGRREHRADLAVDVAGERAVDVVFELVIVTDSTLELLVTVTVNVKLPPGSGRLSGLADLSTVMARLHR